MYAPWSCSLCVGIGSIAVRSTSLRTTCWQDASPTSRLGTGSRHALR
jgi:hypothetical protein